MNRCIAYTYSAFDDTSQADIAEDIGFNEEEDESESEDTVPLTLALAETALTPSIRALMRVARFTAVPFRSTKAAGAS